MVSDSRVAKGTSLHALKTFEHHKFQWSQLHFNVENSFVHWYQLCLTELHVRRCISYHDPIVNVTRRAHSLFFDCICLCICIYIYINKYIYIYNSSGLVISYITCINYQNLSPINKKINNCKIHRLKNTIKNKVSQINIHKNRMCH